MPKGHCAAKFMEGLISAYDALLKTSEESSSGSDSCYSFRKVKLVATKVADFGYSASKSKKDTADVINSGASTTFVTNKKDLANPLPHTETFSTASGKNTKETHKGKYQVTFDNEPIFLLAFSAPTFDQRLISVGQLTKKTKVILTKQNEYLSKRLTFPNDSKLFGTLDANYNLYKKKMQGEKKLSAMHVSAKPNVDSITRAIMNHSNDKKISGFRKQYPLASEKILTRGIDAADLQQEVCEPCVIGKIKRKPFPKANGNRFQK